MSYLTHGLGDIPHLLAFRHDVHPAILRVS